MPLRGCWLFVLACVSAIGAAAMVVAAEEQGEEKDCSAKPCGHLNISRPFWLTDRDAPRPCGPSDFEVTCNDSHTPILRSALFYGLRSGFRIVNVSYGERSLRVVDLYKLGSVSNSCQRSDWNTSVKLGLPFRISPANLNLVLYNCTTAAAAAAARGDETLVEIPGCGNVSSAFVGAGGRYDADGDYAGYRREGCNATVVPVLGEVNATNYMKLISDGFLVTWDQNHPLHPLPVTPGKFITGQNHLSAKFPSENEPQ